MADRIAVLGLPVTKTARLGWSAQKANPRTASTPLTRGQAGSHCDEHQTRPSHIDISDDIAIMMSSRAGICKKILVG